MTNRHSDYHIELIVYQAIAELKAECGRTLGGAVWWVLDPLLSIAVYYVAFALILQRGTADFVAFLCVGIIIWKWFQGTVARGSGSILAAAPLMGKVYAPKILFPASNIVADLFKFAITFLLLLLFLWLSGFGVGMTYWALPVVMFVQILFLSAFAGLCAMIVPFFPDFRNLLTHGLHLLFFMSGIFFDVGRLEGPLRSAVMLNPLAGLIQSFRQVLLHNLWPDWRYLGWVTVFSLLGLGLAVYLITRFDRVYPKIC